MTIHGVGFFAAMAVAALGIKTFPAEGAVSANLGNRRTPVT
jgi:hypothetical protein